MKKFVCLLCTAIIVISALSGCAPKGNTAVPADDNVNFAPDTTAVPSENSSVEAAANAFSGGALVQQATAQPAAPVVIEEVHTTVDPNAADDSMISVEELFGTYDAATDTAIHESASDIDTSTYQFSTMSDTSLGFTFKYPSHWKNNPGIYTVCYREEVEEGDFPARVAITRKKLTHTPEEDDILNHLAKYLKTIYTQYDKKTFEVSSVDKSISFMGKKAYSTTYLAFSGETEVKGFVIGCCIERTLYVFHFSASYADYLSMESMMQYMCKSVTSTGK